MRSYGCLRLNDCATSLRHLNLSAESELNPTNFRPSPLLPMRYRFLPLLALLPLAALAQTPASTARPTLPGAVAPAAGTVTGKPIKGSVGQTKVEWYGHAAFRITTPTGKVLLVDPWLTNPLNATGEADVAALTQADLILVSHGHQDHVGDAVRIAQQTNAKLVTPYDLGGALTAFAGFPAEQATVETQGNIGGRLVLLDGEVAVQFTPATHGSTVTGTDQQPHGAGNPCGFLIEVRNGPVIYHTGDTGLFSDMALLARPRKVDVMLTCIGDHFVMSPEQAAEAVKLVQPTVVVPMHYGTFPVLRGTAAQFRAALAAKKVKAQVEVMDVHQTLTF